MFFNSEVQYRSVGLSGDKKFSKASMFRAECLAFMTLTSFAPKIGNIRANRHRVKPFIVGLL